MILVPIFDICKALEWANGVLFQIKRYLDQCLFIFLLGSSHTGDEK